MIDQNDLTGASLDEIDEALDDWMTRVKQTADRHIPKTSYKLEPYPRPTIDSTGKTPISGP